MPVGTVHEGGLPADQDEGQGGQEKLAGREEKKLAIMMMSKKRKRLYDQIMKSHRSKAREVRELRRRRKEHEETRTAAKRAKVE